MPPHLKILNSEYFVDFLEPEMCRRATAGLALFSGFGIFMDVDLVEKVAGEAAGVVANYLSEFTHFN